MKREMAGSRMPVWLFPAALFYYEIIFRLFTEGSVLRGETALILLFCCAWGGAGYILCTLCSEPRWNRWLAAALLVLAALPYGVETFVYAQFRQYYDLNTIFNGAGDVVTDFTRAMLRLLLSAGGLLRIGAYLLPGAVYSLAAGRSAPRRISGRERAMAAAWSGALLLTGTLIVHMIPGLSDAAWRQYSFQNAVGRFGLMPAMGLDVGEGLFGGAEFQPEETLETAPPAAPSKAPPATARPEETARPEQTPEPVYGKNELDLPLDDPDANRIAARLDRYVAGLTPSSKNAYTGLFKGKNLIMITAEAFTWAAVDPALTPTLYRLSTKGVQFTDFYQPSGAGTTGGEYQILFGLLPTDGGASLKTMVKKNAVTLDMANMLTPLGYYGRAFHDHTYTYYDRDETHDRLGYTDSFMGMGNGMEQYVQEQWPASDYEMMAGTVPTYIDRQPFNVYYMTVSGHGGYGRGENSMASKNWDAVKDLPCSDRVKGYFAATLELEKAMTYLVEQLEAKGIADDTVICMAGDHFPYGLDGGTAAIGALPYLEELYGQKIENAFQRDKNCWILWCGALEDDEPIVVDEPTSSLDILPTLCNLFGVDFDSRLLPGRDVFSDAPALVFNMTYDWKSEYGAYFSVSRRFVPAEGAPEPPEGYVESTNAAVANKINYCKGVLDTAYHTHLLQGG